MERAVGGPDAGLVTDLSQVGVTAREADVLAAVAKRMRNREIAEHLFISVRTVESHISSLMRKLQADDRDMLVRIAEELTHAEPRAHNLPAQLTEFIGRDAEIEEIASLLESNRLITLTGVGGSGKTRLAIQIGTRVLNRFEDGVWFVDLSTLGDPDLVPQALAACLGVRQREDGLVYALTEYLSPKRCLIVLDNCEHLIEACAELCVTLLSGSPQVHVLTTSREPLGVAGETVWPVPTLSLPQRGIADAEAILSSESVRMFAARARRVAPTFELDHNNTRAVAEVCYKLDGIPLAIEFAAARVSHLAPSQILERLHDRMTLLVGERGRVERQQTLQATLEWSHELLNEKEQMLMRRLAVFRGRFGLAAVEGICTDDKVEKDDVLELLGSLVMKSLVAVERSEDELRYRLLETVRLHALEKLNAAGESERFFARHRNWYVEWVEAFTYEEVYYSTDVLSEFVRDVDNLRAAFEWSAREGRRDLVGKLAGRLLGLWFYWNPGEANQWLEYAIEDRERLTPDEEIACLTGLIYSAMRRADLPAIQEYSARGIDLGRTHPSGPLVQLLSMQAVNLATFANWEGMTQVLPGESRSLIEEALKVADSGLFPIWKAVALTWQGMVELILGDDATAARALREGADGIDPDHYAVLAIQAASHLCGALHLTGEDEDALKVAEVLVDLHRTKVPRIRVMGYFWHPAAVAYAAAGDLHAARRVLESALEESRGSGIPLAINEVLLTWGVVEMIAGNPERASRLLSVGRYLRGAADTRSSPFSSPVGWAFYRRYVPLVREALGPDEARRGRDEGRAMSLDEAIAFALSATKAFERLGAQHQARRLAALPPDRSERVRRVLTFVFTDIVDSTPLAELLGDEAWDDLLAWHDRTLRSLFSEHGGEEVHHAGDGFLVAFPGADAAFHCARAIQRTLSEHRRAHGFGPRVRIGIHTTEATERGGEYVGKGVHAAARVGAASQGDEILASRAALDASRTKVPVAKKRSLKLKGLTDPLEVAAVEW